MQYLLTQEEFNNLTHKGNVGERDDALLVAKNALLAATDFPCIYNKEKDNEYCDKCPCAFPSVGHRVSGLLCTLNKEYSQ